MTRSSPSRRRSRRWILPSLLSNRQSLLPLSHSRSYCCTQVIHTGASFNASLFAAIGRAIGMEGRAMSKYVVVLVVTFVATVSLLML
jgi:hypothetical protein